MRYTIETINGNLDTYYDYDVSLNYQLNDVLDLNSTNTNWSKTIKIPGTAANNQFFKSIYDVNIDNNYSFNPLQKVPARLKVGDDVVFDGYMRLLNIQETNKDVEYEISLIGKLGTLFAKIGDYTFGDIDLSEYDHTRTEQSVTSSWYNNVYKNGILQKSDMGDGYVYPYIKYDENVNVNFMAIESMYPAFYAKTIIDKMFRSAGFTYTSEFLEGDIFNRLIIPFNGNKLQLDGNGGVNDKISHYTTTAGVSGYTTTNPALTCEYRGSVFQGGSFFGGTETEKQFTVRSGYGWSYGTTGFNLGSGSLNGVNFSDDAGQILIGEPLSNWQNGFLVSVDGQYDIDINLSLAPLLTNDKVMGFLDSTVGFKSGEIQYRYQLLLLKTDGTRQELDSSINYGGGGQYGVKSFDLPTGARTYNYSKDGIRGTIYEDEDINITLKANSINLQSGDKLIIRVGVNLPSETKFLGTALGGTSDKTYQVTLLPRNKEVSDAYVSTGILKKTDNSSSVNAYISGNQILDNTIKQKDFFLSIIKMFNLVVSDNPNKENDLIIEPYDEWYSTKPEVLDWTYKLDEDSVVKTTPMSDLDFNKYRFTYKEDSDFLNVEYTNESDGLIFGEYSNNVNNPFSDKVNEVEVIFSPTPVMERDGVITPYFVTYENDEYASHKTNIRILFWNGVQSTDTPILMYDTINDYISKTNLVNIFSVYPQATMWNDLTNPTDSLEFGRSTKQYFTTNLFAAGTLYEKYHRNLLESITSPNSKMMECEIVLTPQEMATFDFRNLIFLKESYWRVNEIKNYNPINSDKTTTVVLYKVLEYDIFGKYTVEIPESNVGCQPYVIEKQGTRTYYVNQDGSNPSASCCEAFGGNKDWTGRCLAGVMTNPPDVPFTPPRTNPWGGPETWTPWSGLPPIWNEIPTIHRRPMGGIYTIPIEQPQGPLVLNKYKTRNDGIYIKTFGLNNVIPKTTRNAVIIGNENTLATEIKNTLIVGNEIIARNEGSIYLQNAEITKEGLIRTYGIKIIDGGLDEVFPFNKINPTEIIDGTIDSVRNPGAFSWSRPIIDGGDANNNISE